ncbi:membrane metallo-endopeptidase-like 1 [Drosophila ficusphila]|uniref:membrane metallo-endopeptidase-like 1 n=1 Tax=Drosophila ficusphila TaxID=30025 RepID=UPI001C8AB38F|nr:membrane metallo-endopeptidase-like 1 [Drosophila ficusphila]
MNQGTMFSISKYFRLAWIAGLTYILICGFPFECEARSVDNEPQDDSERENTITDETVEYLQSYGAKMKSYMNFSVDPCDDFYEYSCGNWKNVIKPRLSSDRRSNLLDIMYTLAEVTDQILTRTEMAEALNVSEEVAIAQRFYNACLAADVSPLPAADPAYLALIRSIGGFPAVDGDAWNASSFSWFNMSAHLTNYGASGLINEDEVPHFPFEPYFKLPELGFDHVVHTDIIANSSSRAYKMNEKRMRGYLKSYNLTEEKATAVVTGVFDFWRDALAVEDKFNSSEESCILLDSLHSVPAFGQWRSYYEIAWNGVDFHNGTDSSEYCDFYYTELDKVCAKHQEAVANYLSMALLYRMDAKVKDVQDQKEYCQLTVLGSMAHLINKLYMAKHFDEETHSEISAMIKKLRESFRQMLEHADWLDTETRREALLKEASITHQIGSYKDEEHSNLLIRQYRNLSVVDDSYPQSLINLRRLSISLRRYNGLHFDEIATDTKPLVLLLGMQVNAFYYNRDNSMYVMAGILHPPAYHRSWPDSLKFGTLGYLIGHEVTHGFDTVGATHDSDGQSRNWWSKKSEAVFKERSKCFVDHYSTYLIPEINRKINGNETKDENIADSGGLREALAAYRSHIKQLQKGGEDNETTAPRSDQMPGLDLSPEQLFFLGFAQLWCASYKEEHFWHELNKEHTIDKYRVLGAVTNSEDFAEIYNCKLGSAMHPKSNTCRVW